MLARTGSLSRNLAFRLIAPRKNFEPHKALIICADPRGGSTWLYEILSNIDRTVGLWEPLDIGRAKLFREIGFNYRQYIPEAASNTEAWQAFNALFRGQCLEEHVMQKASLREYQNADTLLVKFCRGTQLLPWLSREFAFKRYPVHLIRHPCAVVASQLRYGAWDHVTPGFEEDDVLSDPLKAPHAECLLKITTIEERLAAYWALVNAIALNHPKRRDKWLTVAYEHLVLDPKQLVSSVLEKWQLEIDDIDACLQNPSQTALQSSPVVNGKRIEQLAYWQKTLSTQQIDLILETTRKIGVTIYDTNSAPRNSGPFI